MPSSPCPCAIRLLASFPTRRSSDLIRRHGTRGPRPDRVCFPRLLHVDGFLGPRGAGCARREVGSPGRRHCGRRGISNDRHGAGHAGDRKSTRLNSSHLGISYAVFSVPLRHPTPRLFPYTTLFRSYSPPRNSWSATRPSLFPPPTTRRWVSRSPRRWVCTSRGRIAGPSSLWETGHFK